MDTQRFSTFGYQHPGRGGISRQRHRAILSGIGAALISGFVFFPAGFLLLLLPLLIYLSAPKQLYIGSRYLICGNVIQYFGNMAQAQLDESSGTLRLTSRSGAVLLLERDKFTTSARKAGKIAANRADKFGKASARIIEKIAKASPDARLSGVPRRSASAKRP